MEESDHTPDKYDTTSSLDVEADAPRIPPYLTMRKLTPEETAELYDMVQKMNAKPSVVYWNYATNDDVSAANERIDKLGESIKELEEQLDNLDKGVRGVELYMHNLGIKVEQHHNESESLAQDVCDLKGRLDRLGKVMLAAVALTITINLLTLLHIAGL